MNPAGFPIDRYTPHGYLDNPAHAWKIPGPSGVMRSRPAIGMGWHYPSLAAAYNRKMQYVAYLQIGFVLPDGTILLDSADLRHSGVDLYCSYHSKNLLRYHIQTPDNIVGTVEFFMPDQEGDTLACSVQVENKGENITKRVSLLAILDYERNLGQGLTWESGMFARSWVSELPIGNQFYKGATFYGSHTIGVYQEGTHFQLVCASQSSDIRLFKSGYKTFSGLHNLEDVREAVKGSLKSSHSATNHMVSFSQLSGEMKNSERCEAVFLVGRGESEKQAADAITPFIKQDIRNLILEQEEEDRAFWHNAPKLYGDWPAHVRHGLVYDFETLRMMVRRPAGIYKNRWDAMQLQVPRVVLGEAGLDMLILSYADPEAAKEVLYGTFADAPEPNVPCSREDGSYNMIASDGSPCGTAPEWCFPFHCINLVYKKTGDKEWLRKLYPYLEDFIGFWITHRVDEHGRPYYKCSWEAGQDNSPRFGIKDDPSGGAALTEHLWPVDLQAALAQCCLLLAEWAAELGQEAPQWAALGQRYTQATQRMWHNGWFHDFDMKQNHFTGVLDTMQLAPLLCGVASPEQVDALMPKLADPPKHGQVFHPMMWPSVAFCLVEACEGSGRPDLAAQHAWVAVDSVYRWLDSDPETVEPDKGGLPGASREYWPQVVAPHSSPPRGGGGAEVYGWGCFTAMLLLRYIVGFVEEPDGFSLTPNLPPELLQPGKVYPVEQLHWRDARINLTYTVKEKLAAEVEISLEREVSVTVEDSAGNTLYQSQPSMRHTLQLNIPNGTTVQFRF